MKKKLRKNRQGTPSALAYKEVVALELVALPNDILKLKHLAVDLSIQVDFLQEELRLARARLYDSRSEKLAYKSNPQLLLFEPESSSRPEPDVEGETTPVGSHNRKKPKRRPLPEALERVEFIYDIPEVQKFCACGCMKTQLGRETSEQLDYVPAILRVLLHIRLKWVCKRCEGTSEPEKPTFAIAPVPPQLVPKSIASPGLLAYIIASKFLDGLPLYRLQMQFSRLGIELTRGTMCAWVIKVADACAPLMKLLHQDLLSGNFIQADETRHKVLKEEGRLATSNSYAWLLRGGAAGCPVTMFFYDPSRSAAVARKLFHGFQGHVQTDGYSGYNFLDTAPSVSHYGCWAHARRGFTDAIKAADEKIGASDSVAQQGVRWIRKLYQVERRADDAKLDVDGRARVRQEESKKILQDLKVWLLDKRPKVPEHSRLGQAIQYTLSQWARLAAYADTGFVPIDNNGAENSIRPFVLGRKAWLFSDTPEGAHATMTLYSIVETAKANGIEPYSYLRHLFERLPHATSEAEYRALLPYHVDRSAVRPYSPPPRKGVPGTPTLKATI